MAFDRRIETAITYRNSDGLPAVFNREIIERNRNKILVFTHDDVTIDDYWLSARLDEGLQAFDVIGVAGNRRRMRHQPAWAFNVRMQWDRSANLTGGVGAIGSGGKDVSYFGKPGQPARLLDGVFIAARTASLLDRSVQFDERFIFHFYDLDFCRSAEQRGLTLGTWPVAISHASGGSFGTAEWNNALKLYRRKWPD